jgi:hypothetical protein
MKMTLAMFDLSRSETLSIRLDFSVAGDCKIKPGPLLGGSKEASALLIS